MQLPSLWNDPVILFTRKLILIFPGFGTLEWYENQDTIYEGQKLPIIYYCLNYTVGVIKNICDVKRNLLCSDINSNMNIHLYGVYGDKVDTIYG